MDLELAKQLLPSAITKASYIPEKLKYLLIAEPKWGKTSWMTAFPDSLLLAFEPGHSFTSTHKIAIDHWDSPRGYAPYEEELPPEQQGPDHHGLRHMTLEQATGALEAIPEMFKFIIFDTADMMGKMCLDWHLPLNGVKHQSELEQGKGYELCLGAPVRRMVQRILATGRGIGFISHAVIKDAKFASGAKAKKECTLDKQLSKFMVPLVDVILFGSYGIKAAGTKVRPRVLTTEGSEDVLAGARLREIRLPSRFVVDPDNSYNQWNGFFKDPKSADEAEAQYRKMMREKEAEPAAESPADAVAT